MSTSKASSCELVGAIIGLMFQQTNRAVVGDCDYEVVCGFDNLTRMLENFLMRINYFW